MYMQSTIIDHDLMVFKCLTLLQDLNRSAVSLFNTSTRELQHILKHHKCFYGSYLVGTLP
jgi:hypothetical protein